MNMLEDNKGITLTALVITIIILLILATTAVYTGTETIQNSKLTAFNTEMSIIQSQVDSMQNIIDQDNKIDGISIFEKGRPIDMNDPAIKTLTKDLPEIDLTDFRSYNKEDIEKYLGIDKINQVVPVLINLKTASVISVKGIKYQEDIYHRLEDLPDSIKKIEHRNTIEEKPTFNISSESTQNEKKIILSDIIISSEYVIKYKIEYQAEGNLTWVTVAENLSTNNYSFRVESPGVYNVKITDNKGKVSEIETIEIAQ